jgi:hypothetical protein
MRKQEIIRRPTRFELKRQMPRLLALTLFALLPPVSWGAGYICTTDMVTGFSSKGGEWKSADFEPNRKFIVSPATQAEQAVVPTLFAIPDAKWSVLVLGDKRPTNVCPEFDTTGDLICPGLFSEFRMNKDSLRFLYAYLSGYWDRTPPGSEAGDTPYIAIGKCRLM